MHFELVHKCLHQEQPSTRLPEQVFLLEWIGDMRLIEPRTLVCDPNLQTTGLFCHV